MPNTAVDLTGALGAALQRVGDRWSLLVVAALLDGPLRYGEVQQRVPGIATNVLASRLRDLESAGLVGSHAYSERPLRLEYELTSVGAELAGAMRLLAAWGASAGPEAGAGSGAGGGGAGRGAGAGAGAGGPAGPTGEAPAHAVCGTPLEVRYWCPTCQQVAEDEEEVWA